MNVLQTIVFWVVIFGVIVFYAWLAKAVVSGVSELMTDDTNE